ncbi:MAG: dienelactone hydrolase family protein [Chitinophagaceae bacterium]
MKKSLLLFLVIGPLITFAQLTPKSINTGKEGVIGFYEFKPGGYNPDSTYLYPLIIFLHGIGERGNGTTELHMALNSSFPKYLVKGATMKFTIRGRQHAFLVLMPQMSKDYVNWQNFYVDAMIEYARKNLKIDTNRIFLTGWSLGGGGAWKYATASVENARKVAGIIPVSPAPDYTDLCNLARGKVAVWVHHARDDASIPLHYSEDAITGINACSPDIPPLITYYPSGGHPYVAEWAYDTLNKIEYPNLYQWMIGTSRANSLATNQDPFANAGNDTLVILPSTSATLKGDASFDPNDVIIQYKWTVISGPSSPELKILKPDFPVTGVSGLEPGNYTFRLTVKDEFGVSKSDNINIEVMLPLGGMNATPVVNAGQDVIIREANYHLKGSGRDYDGTIKSFHWRQVSGPVTITVEENGKMANLWGITQKGTYGIELSACDNHNPCGIGRDTVFITRNVPMPVYFNYWSKENPAIRNPDVHRYGLLVVFILFFSVPALIFNSFTIRNFKDKRLHSH